MPADTNAQHHEKRKGVRGSGAKDYVIVAANTPPNSGLLCPGCRKLVSADERRCPHCGLSNPGARWRHTAAARLMGDGGRLLQAIIVVNAVMYVFTLIMGGRGLGVSTNPLSLLAPDTQGLLLLGATGTLPIDGYQRWWTLISASYLHGGLLHIVFNMLALRQIGALVIELYGTHRMLMIYTISGVGGFLLSYLAGVRFTIGASAAVCGLIGAALFYGKSRGGPFGQAVYRQVGGWAIGIILFGLVVPGINNWAHGGGMAAGILLGWRLGYRERLAASGVHRLLGTACLWGTGAILAWAIFSAWVPR